MTILEELNTLIEDQGIPVETGLFSKNLQISIWF